MTSKASLAEAFRKGVAAANAEMRAANPVLEDLIEGLEIIKANRGNSGSFDYEMQSLPWKKRTTLRTTVRLQKITGQGASEIEIVVGDEGSIKYKENSENSMAIDNPGEADIVAVLEDIAKQARLSRQVVPDQSKEKPEDTIAAMVLMQAELEKGSKAGQRNPGCAPRPQ